MYLGRQVVCRSASTLRPVAGSRVRASTSTPWQIAPTGRPSAQNRATCSLQHRRAEVLPHPRRVPAGQQQAVEGGRVQVGPGQRPS